MRQEVFKPHRGSIKPDKIRNDKEETDGKQEEEVRTSSEHVSEGSKDCMSQTLSCQDELLQFSSWRSGQRKRNRKIRENHSFPSVGGEGEETGTRRDREKVRGRWGDREMNEGRGKRKTEGDRARGMRERE